MSESTTHGALKQMDHSSSRPRRVPLFQLRTVKRGCPIFVTTLYLPTATSNGIMCHDTKLECGLHKLAHVNCSLSSQSSADRSGICGGCLVLLSTCCAACRHSPSVHTFLFRAVVVLEPFPAVIRESTTQQYHSFT